MYRSSSFLLSVIFHLSIVVLIVFWPGPSPRVSAPLTGAMVQGLVTIGKTGGPAKIQSQPAKDMAPGKTTRQDEAKPAEVKTPAKQDKLEAETPARPAQEVKPVQKPVEDPKPLEKKPVDKPVENPEAVKIAEKPTEKPKETKPKVQEKPKEKPKTEPKEEAASDQAKPKTPPQQTKPQQTKPQQAGSAADKALAELNKQSAKPSGKPSGKPSAKRGGTTAADALKEFQSVAGGGDGSGAGSGEGYGEAGYGDGALIGSYTDSLVSRIRPNWRWTGLADRRALEAVFLIKVAPDGTIESHQLIQPSGSSSFDASVTNAIASTRQVEPPPSSIPNGEIVVIFRPDDMR